MADLFDSLGNIYGNKYWGYKEITIEDIVKYNERWEEITHEDDFQSFKTWLVVNYPDVEVTGELLIKNGFLEQDVIDNDLIFSSIYKIKEPSSEFQKRFRIKEEILRNRCEFEISKITYFEGDHTFTVEDPELLHTLQAFFRLAEGEDIFSLDIINKTMKHLPDTHEEEDDLPF